MKILVTGIAGFIGLHVTKALVARGHEVCGVDNFNDYYPVALKQARIAELGSAVRIETCDIADAGRLAGIVCEGRFDAVLHLAAQAGVRYAMKAPFAYAQSNLIGHLSVLEACRQSETLSHLVYASSSSVYGNQSPVPFREDQVVDAPVSLYAATKRSAELMSSTYAHLHGVKQVGLRFFTVYGPWGRPDMAYWIFTRKILAGEPIQLFNYGQMRRDMTHIDDIVTGVLATLEQPPVFASDVRPHTVYNVGNDTPETLSDVVDTLEAAIGRKAVREMTEMSRDDVIETHADITRLRRDYGYNPTTPIAKGLPDFVAWYRTYHKV